MDKVEGIVRQLHTMTNRWDDPAWGEVHELVHDLGDALGIKDEMGITTLHTFGLFPAKVGDKR